MDVYVHETSQMCKYISPNIIRREEIDETFWVKYSDAESLEKSLTEAQGKLKISLKKGTEKGYLNHVECKIYDGTLEMCLATKSSPTGQQYACACGLEDWMDEINKLLESLTQNS